MKTLARLLLALLLIYPASTQAHYHRSGQIGAEDYGGGYFGGERSLGLYHARQHKVSLFRLLRGLRSIANYQLVRGVISRALKRLNSEGFSTKIKRDMNKRA